MKQIQPPDLFILMLLLLKRASQLSIIQSESRLPHCAIPGNIHSNLIEFHWQFQGEGVF